LKGDLTKRGINREAADLNEYPDEDMSSSSGKLLEVLMSCVADEETFVDAELDPTASLEEAAVSLGFSSGLKFLGGVRE